MARYPRPGEPGGLPTAQGRGCRLASMPLKLIFVVLATVGLVALSVYEIWLVWMVHFPNLLDLINLGAGLVFIAAVALGRGWTRPMGVTLGGMLMFQAMFVLFAMAGANGQRGNMGPDEVTLYSVSNYAGKLVLGGLMIACMRSRDVIGWIVRRSGSPVG